MGKVDVGCGESVVHGSTDGLGRKRERAEAMRAGLRGSSPGPFVGLPSVMRSTSRPVGSLNRCVNPLCRAPGKQDRTADDKAPEPMLGGLCGCLIV